MSLMIFPLDINELSVLFAVIAITLLITGELLSSSHSRTTFIDRKRLRRGGIVFSAAFMATVSVRIMTIIFSML